MSNTRPYCGKKRKRNGLGPNNRRIGSPSTSFKTGMGVGIRIADKLKKRDTKDTQTPKIQNYRKEKISCHDCNKLITRGNMSTHKKKHLK